ncbi:MULTISPECIES: RNA polymerase sigma factor SigM [Gordonia]|uniref:RNA polymerase sigma factor SigM n=2 Tax=Gordonia TaxID=2053 RepID=A0ABP5U2G8_9ACTN|nr:MULTISPECIES: RNA polymerase sigma factor SigM [Gordonia]AUH67514.1 RNA polymerase sigma factor SigM [Gordonia sp. YC-JH1]KJR09638.1 RNA polymerase sigma factor SigM [Gordonia sihwensis]KXT56977.1 RNA polymerase sigma factor SigM [Gordonia sp. QH-12]MBY4568477.1 RNA polymerase sigma factor SigM [Gordonia sihwensis]WFN92818.1 RNA polymerase sigma factor SigM [Gordonia sihwensis]
MTRGIIDQKTDAHLLRAHIGGDAGAFRELYERHRNHLWAIALRTTGNEDDAADAMQDAWISIYRTATSYRADASVSSWLHKIVVNSCLDRLRRIRCHETMPLIEFESALLADERDYTVGIDVGLSIGRALDVLPPDQRDAVILVDYHGYSIRDAAAILSVACGTVKSRCSRGRAKLAMVLEYLDDDC